MTVGLDMLLTGVRQYQAPSSFAEVGIDNQGAAWLQAAAAAGDVTQFLFFASYDGLADGKSLYLGLENNGTAQGFRTDFHNGTNGTQKPAIDILITGATATNFADVELALNDRIHVLVSGEIAGGNGTEKMWRWDATGGAWVKVGEATSPGATAYLFSTGLDGFAWFASNSGQRIAGVINYRSAFWTDNELTSFPDINNAAVRDNFTNGANIVDPAISIAAYGTPLHEPLNTVAGMNAGTNSGSGGNYTVAGTFVAG